MLLGRLELRDSGEWTLWIQTSKNMIRHDFRQHCKGTVHEKSKYCQYLLTLSSLTCMLFFFLFFFSMYKDSEWGKTL